MNIKFSGVYGKNEDGFIWGIALYYKLERKFHIQFVLLYSWQTILGIHINSACPGIDLRILYLGLHIGF